MRSRVLLVALLPLVAACVPEPPPVPPPPPAPPRAVGPQPWGLKRCDAEPRDYPDPQDVPRPAKVAFALLPLDPTYLKMGVSLITFRSAELIFHVSPTLPQATVDCAVAAADDAVAFVNRTVPLRMDSEGGVHRDLFLLDPATSATTLKRLDQGNDIPDGPAFVGTPPDRPLDRAIFHHRKVPVSYLDLGEGYAHEWTHMIQDHLRGHRPGEITTVVEGEAGLLAALFLDAVVPGAGNQLWDEDASMLAAVSAKHPDLTLDTLLRQPPHRYHQELTLFAYMAREVNPPVFAEIRRLSTRRFLAYETAFRHVVGRDLIEPGLEAVVRSPKLAPRPALPPGPPALSIVRSEDELWFIARGFVPGEWVSRTIRVPESTAIPDALEADARGVVSWTVHLDPGTRYAPREVELRSQAGTCSGKYSVRAPVTMGP